VATGNWQPATGNWQPATGNRQLANGKRLTRIARSKDVHRATPWAAVEGDNVVPDRRRIQGRVFHPRHEDGRGEGVPLDITHSAVSGLGQHEAEVEPSGAGVSARGGMQSQVMQGTSRRFTKKPPAPGRAERPGFNFIAGARRTSIDAPVRKRRKNHGRRGRWQPATGNRQPDFPA